MSVLVGCGGGGQSAPKVEEPSAAASASPEAAPNAVASAAPSAEAPPAAPPSPVVDECVALGRFPASAYQPAEDGSGKKTVVPWMEDPLGEKPVKPKKGKKPKPDPHVEAMRQSFRKCIDIARQLDSASTTALSFEHKPKGGEHKMCIHVQRDEGRSEVTKDFAKCMLDAIKEWATKAP